MFVCVCVFVFACVCVCVISNQSTRKKYHYVSDLTKLDALLRKIHSDVFHVVIYQGFICLDP